MSTASRHPPVLAALILAALVRLVGDGSLLAQPPAPEVVPAEELPAIESVSGWLGVVLEDSFAPHGVLIVGVARRSPAEKAGLRPGDLIRRLVGTIPGDATPRDATPHDDTPHDDTPRDDTPHDDTVHEVAPRDALDVAGLVGDHQAGDTITLTILRRGVLVKLTATLATAPATHAHPDVHTIPHATPPHSPRVPLPLPPAAADWNGRAKFGPPQAWLGVETAPVTNRARRFYHLPSNKGAVVNYVYAGSPAQRAGIKPGAVIRAIDSREVTDPRDVARFVAEAGVGRRVEISLWADDVPVWLHVWLDAHPLDVMPTPLAPGTTAGRK